MMVVCSTLYGKLQTIIKRNIHRIPYRNLSFQILESLSQIIWDVCQEKNNANIYLSEMDSNKCFLCGNENSFLCPHCQMVWVCAAHHDLHRAQDKCWPWTIVQKPGVGRCLVASRDIG